MLTGRSILSILVLSDHQFREPWARRVGVALAEIICVLTSQKRRFESDPLPRHKTQKQMDDVQIYWRIEWRSQKKIRVKFAGLNEIYSSPVLTFKSTGSHLSSACSLAWLEGLGTGRVEWSHTGGPVRRKQPQTLWIKTDPTWGQRGGSTELQR